MGSSLPSLIRNDGSVTICLGKRESVKINKADLIHCVDSSFVYPREKSAVDEKIRTSHVKAAYTCDDHSCNFLEALKKIVESEELKGLGVNNLSEVIVSTIDQNPDVFPSKNLGGYLFQSTGMSFLYLENKTLGMLDNKPRYGFVDLTAVRKKLLFEAMRSKEQNRSSDMKDFFFGASIGVSACLIVSFVFNRK